MRFKIFFCGALIGMAACSFAIPEMLIVQQVINKHGTDEAPSDYPVANVLAQELESAGKVSPIVWSMTDPIFRTAVEEGQIKNPSTNPSIQQALAVAGKMHFSYVGIVSAFQKGNGMMARMVLYKSGRAIWVDPPKEDGNSARGTFVKDRDGNRITDPSKGYRMLSVTIGSALDTEATARSLARTWSQLLGAGPLAGLQAQPKIGTPTPSPGQVPTAPPPVPATAPRPTDNVQLFKDVALLTQAGQTAQAVNLLRDAVDNAPLNVDRRIALIKLLINCGQPESAATEARRAADLMPDKVGLRAMAARAWLQSAKPEEAQKDLNEAIARDPDGAETRLLLGESCLAQLNFVTAIDHLDHSIKAQPTEDGYFERALAEGLNGDPDTAKIDLTESSKIPETGGPDAAAKRYDFALDLIGRSSAGLGNDIRTLMQRALVQRKDQSVADGATQQSKLVQGRLALLESVPTPAIHKNSRDRMVLAFKLLAQCLTDIQSHLKEPSEDVITDARINLGEALKQIESAKAAMKSETAGTKIDEQAGKGSDAGILPSVVSRR